MQKAASEAATAEEARIMREEDESKGNYLHWKRSFISPFFNSPSRSVRSTLSYSIIK